MDPWVGVFWVLFVIGLLYLGRIVYLRLRRTYRRFTRD